MDANKRNKINNIMRWLIFGILIVVTPPLFNVWLRIIIGFNVNFIEYIPDILIVLLSVCCNMINTYVDGEKSVSYIERWIVGIIMGIISIGCWGLFFVVRIFSNYINQDVLCKVAEYSFDFATFVIIACVILGIRIEINTANSKE